MKRTLKWIDQNFEEYLEAVILLLLCVIMNINVFSRYALKNDLTWANEISKYLLVYAGFISIGWWTRRTNGIRIDVVVSTLPKILQDIFLIFTQVITLAFLILAYLGAMKIFCNSMNANITSEALGISQGWSLFGMVFGFLLGVFRSFQSLILTVIKICRENSLREEK